MCGWLCQIRTKVDHVLGLGVRGASGEPREGALAVTWRLGLSRLFISLRTVQTHLAHVFARLGPHLPGLAAAVTQRRDSRDPAATRVIRRNTNCRHMIGDHHGRTVKEQPRWSEPWTRFPARTAVRHLEA